MRLSRSGVSPQRRPRTSTPGMHDSPTVQRQTGERDRGEFVKPGQTDWAVLCSTKGSTSLLVFWNGSETNSVQLANNPDNPGRIDLFIRAVDRKFIMDHYRAYGGPEAAAN